jgi:excisionase family DNA binding protein
VSALDFLSPAARRELEALIDERVNAGIARHLAFAQPSRSPYLTVAEAAQYLRCSRQRVYDLLSQRRLPRVKEGSRTLISREEIARYLGSDRVAPALPCAPQNRIVERRADGSGNSQSACKRSRASLQ